jgi:hypothetical protein
MEKHICEKQKDLEQLEAITESGFLAYGPAINNTMYYREVFGTWSIGNDEYESLINFCPYCGIELKTLENK